MSGQQITFKPSDIQGAEDLTFSANDIQPPGAPPPAAPAPAGIGGPLGVHADVGIGIAKGAANTLLDLAKLVQLIPGVGQATNAVGNAIGGAAGQMLYGTKANPVSNETAMSEAAQHTKYTNTPQKVGGALETVAELAAPIGKVPTTAKAGAKFEQVMAAAKDLPVDAEVPGNVALRIAELAQHGGGTNWGPAPVRQLIQYLTDPKKPQLTYKVAREFASNISRLSAKEMASIPPAMHRELQVLRVALNESIAQTAQKAGKGAEYKEAMREFAQAKRILENIDGALKGAKKYAPWMSAGGAAGAAYRYFSGKD